MLDSQACQQSSFVSAETFHCRGLVIVDRGWRQPKDVSNFIDVAAKACEPYYFTLALGEIWFHWKHSVRGVKMPS